jgi:hypothetical protein
MERLRKRKERKGARPHDLIFGNTKGRPDSEMDTVVKRVAERAGLNCGQCVTEHNNKCADGPNGKRPSVAVVLKQQESRVLGIGVRLF